MDADHATAWSKGGATDISNCVMLCKTHNRAKGNDMVSKKSICKKQEKSGVQACPVVTTMIFVHRPRPAPGQ